MDIQRSTKYQQKLHQQMEQYHPEVTNQAYIEHKKKDELKRQREEMRKKTDELEKIKKHHRIDKTNKSKFDGTSGKIRPEKQSEIDHTI
jgi:hypothetical protein